MKYMGSKRAMLTNGLGEILQNEVVRNDRFVDLFSGSGAVSTYVAQNFHVPVAAVDLQLYSAILTSAVVGRRRRLRWECLWNDWESRAIEIFQSRKVPRLSTFGPSEISHARDWCARTRKLPITRAYGGHYYSPEQAVWIDALRTSLPSGRIAKTTALAALIRAASQCAAAPGHTAQPFQPTRTALPYLQEAWSRDVAQKTKAAFGCLSDTFALRRGAAYVADANKFSRRLRQGDLVFIDPPYSGVQYSRFYHVLETIAHGECGSVDGVGRYPDVMRRPKSMYSMRSESSRALSELLWNISNRKARAILTFPNHNCSNGLSGTQVRSISSQYFSVSEYLVDSKFSTLGGNNRDNMSPSSRAARHDAKELVLILDP